MPSRSNTVARTSPASGSSRGNSRGSRAMTSTFVPNRANTWASSQPIGPPPMMINEDGAVGALTASRFVQTSPSGPDPDARNSARPVDVGNRRGGAGGDHDVLAAVDPVADGDLQPAVPVPAGQPAGAAGERAALALEAFDRNVVVPVVGGLSADPLGNRAEVR